ncbi:MAG: peptide/nickel transport system substrate-binding protein [Pseudonocardiales bacterium]|jgi:peptide/nickel transport system substrate-binding protein|nr:peptide/nickel transport system substrate-binding protein [Pseudonocardiales bacterium]
MADNNNDDGSIDRLAVMAEYEVSRRTMLRAGVLGAGGLGLSALLAACGTNNGSSTSKSSASTSTGKAKHGGNLILARAQDAVDMDKTMVFSNASIWVYVQIYETLTTGSKDGRSVEPWLATSWTQSADKLSWTFKLRPDIKFSDGTPMTSADVKFSLDQASSTKGGWEFINSAIASVTAPDPQTVVVKTKYPWAPLLADLACPSNGIIPNNYGGKSKTQFYNAPVGTGPFKWSSWQKGSKLTLTKNTNYWRAGLPYLDSVAWQVVPDDNTRNVMIQGNTAQINENPPLATVAQLESASGVTVTLFPSTRTDYILMNEKFAPFADVHVRRAISYAIDRESLVKTVLFGHSTVANSLFMPTVPYYDKNTPGQTFDMSKAKAELAQSKYQQGFSCTYLASSGDSTDSAIAQVLQASLKQLGINMKITNSDPSAVHDLQNKLQYEISHSYWTMDIADPDELVQFAVLPEGGGHSFETNYNDPQAQAVAKQAEQTFDPVQRQKLYTQLQTMLAESAFLPALFYQPLPYAMRSNVKGFFVAPTGLYDMGVVSMA